MMAYHTCQYRDCKENLMSGPFLSEETDRTWLTQGYYFWTDVDDFAHMWGKKSIKGRYAILECELNIKDGEYLDLVGNLKHQKYIYDIIKLLNEKIKEKDKYRTSTIRQALLYLKKNTKFPFIGIRAKDDRKGKRVKIVDTMTDTMTLLERHQFCLFEKYENRIDNKNIYFIQEEKNNV